MVDQIRFFAGAARMLEGRAAGEYMSGFTSYRAARAGRGLRRGDAVELPDDDGGVEVGPGAGGGQHVVLKPSDTTRSARCCWPS